MTNLNGSDLQGFIRRRKAENQRIVKYSKEIDRILKGIKASYKEIEYLDKQINKFSEIV